MLKSCWDCIAGTQEQSSSENYQPRSQLNGDSQRAPPWPETQNRNDIMFILPRKLNDGDRVTISGILNSNPEMLSVTLVPGDNYPDYQNIAFQLEAQFPNGSSDKDRIVMSCKINGVEETKYLEDLATDVFASENFAFSFTLRVVNSNNGEVPIIDVYVSDSNLGIFELQHNVSSIRFLNLSGDISKVEQLDFKFS